MPYDHDLAQRVRQALRGRPDVVEKAMFGGVAFMVAGNMCCGVNRDDLIIRLQKDTIAADLGSPSVRLWDFMKHPMPGMFAVAGDGCANQKSVDHWVNLAVTHLVSLPAKVTRAAKSSSRVPKKGR